MSTLSPADNLRETDAWASATLRRSSRSLWWAVRLICDANGFTRFCRVYGYFRWADDIVDAPDRDAATVDNFVQRQRRLLDGQQTADDPAEHALLAALNADAPAILRPAIDGMWQALAFDARREAQPLTGAELTTQVERIGDAYLAGLLACSGHEGEVPAGALPLSRAATAAHYIRDLFIDRELGYFNLPAEVAEGLGIDAMRFSEGEIAPYAVERLAEVQGWFEQGSAALPQLTTRRARALVRLLSVKYGRLTRRLAGHYSQLR